MVNGKGLQGVGLFPVLLFVLFLSGCASPSIVLNIQANESLNQDIGGQSYSVMVRMYQLRTAEEFHQADYQLLLEQNSSILGNSLVSVEEFIVEPGQQQSLEFPRESGADYFGAVAFFRRVDSDHWRVSGKLRNGPMKPATTRAELQLKDNQIHLNRTH